VGPRSCTPGRGILRLYPHSRNHSSIPTRATIPCMELKHLIRQFSYKIEAKPEGGFIARSADPSAPPLEAATRAELETKIQANFAAALGLAFPGLKIPVDNRNVKVEVHIDRKPEGGFSVHSEEVDPSNPNPGTHEKMDHFAEQLLGFVDKNFPQLSQQLAAQAGAKGITIFTTQNGGATSTTNPSTSLGPMTLTQAMTPTPTFSKVFTQPSGPGATGAASDLTKAGLDNTPITPEATSTKAFFRLLLFALMVAAMIWLISFRR